MAGDRQALDELVAGYLPLVYNIVGRALGGHADVDDVVQETMLRAVHGLDGLRDPSRFRPWLVAIAMRQVRDRGRALTAARTRAGDLDDGADIADPEADFVDLTLLRLDLSGQHREVAEATRWLDDGDRELLSLWWLEAGGELTREELADAMGVSVQHAAVRVQRMKAQLEASRAVVRALMVRPRCGELGTLLWNWDGRPQGLWRKRIVRHTRACATCGGSWENLVAVERLLAGLALVPLPVAMVAHVLATVHSVGSGAAAVAPATHVAGAASGGGHTTAHTTTHTAVPAARAAGWAGRLMTKPIMAAVGAVVIGGAGVFTYAAFTNASSEVPTAVAAPTSEPRDFLAVPPSPPPTPPPTSIPATTSVPPTSSSGKPTVPSSTRSVEPGPLYGSNVDKQERPPAINLRPRALPQRLETRAITATGRYADPHVGSIGGKYIMYYRGDYLTIKGRGYFQLRYEIAWFNRPGAMVMPTWTGLRGKLFHVASGGGRRMDDTKPGATDPAMTWMGDPAKGYITLPSGAQQMWQNEFFYLDGEVTLHNNERGSDYNLAVTPRTWAEVTKDIETAPNPDPRKGLVRYGMVRDTGDDGCPVPQYLTVRGSDDPATVPQGGQLR